MSNVAADSSPGHEAPYVIVSTVRTTRPGFLCMLNRMNVMLTRCNTGMVLVTNRRFLNDAGRDTLLGKLARRWNGSSNAWIDALELSDRRASLPGAPAAPKARPDCVEFTTPGSASRSQLSTGSGLRPTGFSVPTRAVVPSRTAVVPTAATRPASNVAALFQQPQPSSSARFNGYQPMTGITQKLDAGFGAMRIVGGDPEAFPALGGGYRKKVNVPLGQWRRGSEACKL